MAHATEIPEIPPCSCGSAATMVVWDYDRRVGYYCRECAQEIVDQYNAKERVSYTENRSEYD